MYNHKFQYVVNQQNLKVVAKAGKKLD